MPSWLTFWKEVATESFWKLRFVYEFIISRNRRILLKLSSSSILFWLPPSIGPELRTNVSPARTPADCKLALSSMNLLRWIRLEEMPTGKPAFAVTTAKSFLAVMVFGTWSKLKVSCVAKMCTNRVRLGYEGISCCIRRSCAASIFFLKNAPKCSLLILSRALSEYK